MRLSVGLGMGEALEEKPTQRLVAALVDLLGCGEELRAHPLWGSGGHIAVLTRRTPRTGGPPARGSQASSRRPPASDLVSGVSQRAGLDSHDTITNPRAAIRQVDRSKHISAVSPVAATLSLVNALRVSGRTC